jgi:hypothetical protein
LAQYVDLIAEVPLPTKRQKENFVAYLSHAHSWYKKLPPCPPGTPFYFFIDKYAGCDLAPREDGRVVLVERTEQGHHYAALPTDQYRTRFGYLNFNCGGSTDVVRKGKWLVMPIAAVPGDDGQLYGLPAEILEAGVARLTAMIHTATCPSYWHEGFRRTRLTPPWYVEGFHVSNPELLFADPVLYELLGPERTRQYGEMIKAMDRVCEVIERQKERSTQQDV